MKAAAGARGLMRRPAQDSFPYPDAFQPAERAVIDAALITALRAVKSGGILNLQSCDEVAVTVQLQLALNRMLEASPPVVTGFTKAVFQTVIRGGQICNHDGNYPDKSPDLAFRSQRTLPALAFPDQCALLIECKLVDRAHTMALYGGEGIARFVAGAYAWAVSSAVMLGYARDGYHPTKQLSRHLARYGVRYALVDKLRKRDSGRSQPAFYVTVHDRSLPKLPQGASARIELHHLWFKIS